MGSYSSRPSCLRLTAAPSGQPGPQELLGQAGLVPLVPPAQQKLGQGPGFQVPGYRQ